MTKRNCLLLGALVLSAGVAFAASITQSAVKANAIDVEDLGALVQCEHTGELLYAKSTNLPSFSTTIDEETVCWPQEVEGYTTGYIKINGEDVADETTSINFIMAASGGEKKTFWVGKGSTVFSSLVNGDVITVGGLWKIDDYYFKLDDSKFNLIDAGITRSFAQVQETGSLLTNENTSSGVLYTSPENAVSLTGGWNYYFKAMDDSGEYAGGHAAINGTAFTGELKCEYISAAVGFAIFRYGGNLPQNIGDTVTIGGLFRDAKSWVYQYFYINDTTFRLGSSNWERIQNVTFDSKGGSNVDSQVVVYNSAAEEPVAPTRDHASFDYWYLDDPAVAYDFSTPVTSDIKLNAKWTVEKHTVSFDSKGGSTVSPQEVEYGSCAVEPTDVVLEGHTLKNWYITDPDTSYDFSTPVTSDLTLNANWETNVYTVTFDTKGGSTVEQQSVIHGNKATKPADPTLAGNTFKYWYLDNETVAYDFNTLVTSNITLNAKWEKNAYTVTFDSKGGSAVTQQSVLYGNKATKPADPTKDHYVFKYWYATDEATEYNFNTPVTGNLTLNAKWELQTFAVKFVDEDGTVLATLQVGYNEKVTAPTTPVKDGYKFLGWYSGDKVYDFDTPVTGELVLTAKWQKNSNTGVIIGASVGGVVLIGAIVATVIIIKKRKVA